MGRRLCKAIPLIWPNQSATIATQCCNCTQLHCTRGTAEPRVCLKNLACSIKCPASTPFIFLMRSNFCRPDEQREADGVAELRRGARRKGVNVPLTALPLTVSRQLRRPNDIAAQLTAVQIASLTQALAPSLFCSINAFVCRRDLSNFMRTIGQTGRYQVLCFSSMHL